MKKLKCYLFGHKYQIEKIFDANNQKLKCNCCNKRFGINHSTRSLLDWDLELEMLFKDYKCNQKLL